jgi:hypothetical protein
MAGGFGNVYVFNLYVENILKVNLNGQGTAGSIIAPAQTTKPPYAPQQIVVSRTNLNQDQLNSPLFVQGSNTITVDYYMESWTAAVTIDPVNQSALQNDLWIYLCYQTAWLLDTTGDFQTFSYSQASKMVLGRQVITNQTPTSMRF